MVKKKISLLFFVSLLACVLSASACSISSRQVDVEPVSGLGVDAAGALERLSGAIPFETISYQDYDKVDASAFLAFHDYLEEAFPLVHKRLKKELVNELSLLYTWEGTDPSLSSVMLTAHQDVVPIAAGTEGDWTYPPFSGDIADGFIWGRGTMDDKGSLMGILEAVETLLGQGYSPKRTIYLAFGHDEEVGGRRGAGEIAKLLKSRGITAEFVLDEGGTIVEKVLPGLDMPIALIGIAEKGYMSVELLVRDEGGHSSMPPFHSAIGVLATAIHKLERDQMPARLEGPARQMFLYVAPEMEGYMKVVLGNPAIFEPLIMSQLVKNRATNSAIRTTTAVTMIDAGTKENVLPQQAKAVANFRLLPGDTREEVLEHIRKTIDDPRVEVTPIGNFSREASKVTDLDSRGYQVVARTLRQVFPDVVVAPFLMPGGTDTKHYGEISGTLLRCLPMRTGPDDLKRAHGTNERMSVDNYEEIVTFYMQIIKNVQ